MLMLLNVEFVLVNGYLCRNLAIIVDILVVIERQQHNEVVG